MRRVLSAVLFLGLASVIGAAPTDEPEILLPTPSVVIPTPMPAAVTRLAKGQRYVIQAKTKCDVECSPEGLVAVTEKSGPRDWTAVFAGGTGFEEDRHFSYPILYALAPVKTGTTTVLVVPNGAKSKTQWRKFVLDVDVGDPAPTPIPPVVDPLTRSFQAALDLEPATVTDKAGAVRTKQEYAAKLAALYSQAGTVTAQDATVKTYGDLFAVIQAAATFPPTAMPHLRKAVADYLDPRLKPTNAKAIDRTAVAAEFAAVANALKGVK